MGISEVNTAQCDCCGSANTKILPPHGLYDHVRCGDCGYEHFDKTCPDVAAGLYENDADYSDDLTIASNSEDLILWHHNHALGYLQNNFDPGKTAILDVGCFNGFFVKKLVSLGFDAHGIDFNSKAVAYGREKLGLGARISSATVEQWVEDEKRFDVITLFEVLEHLPEARPFLAKVLKLLKDEGVIVISTPNGKMCWRPPLDYPPHHVSRFTLKSLEACLSGLGMRSLYAAEQMSTYDLVRHYTGTFFRAKERSSLRGGEFKYKSVTTGLRRMLNRFRRGGNVILTPLDRLLHRLGFRYISQIIVAGRRPS